MLSEGGSCCFQKPHVSEYPGQAQHAGRKMPGSDTHTAYAQLPERLDTELTSKQLWLMSREPDM